MRLVSPKKKGYEETDRGLLYPGGGMSGHGETSSTQSTINEGQMTRMNDNEEIDVKQTHGINRQGIPNNESELVKEIEDSRQEEDA